MPLIREITLQAPGEGSAPQPTFVLHTDEFDRAATMLRRFPLTIRGISRQALDKMGSPTGPEMPPGCSLIFEFGLDDPLPGQSIGQVGIPDDARAALQAANQASRQVGFVLQAGAGDVARRLDLPPYTPYILDWDGWLGVSLAARTDTQDRQVLQDLVNGMRESLDTQGYMTGLYTETGYLYRMVEMWEQAKGFYGHEIRESRTPDGGPGIGGMKALCNIGVLAKKVGALGSARDCFGIALWLNPNYFESLLSIAGIVPDHDLAIRCLARATAVRPNNPVLPQAIAALAGAGVGVSAPAKGGGLFGRVKSAITPAGSTETGAATLSAAVQQQVALVDLDAPLAGVLAGDPRQTKFWIEAIADE